MITLEQLHQLLTFGVKNGASDIHLKVDEPPAFRMAGGLLPLKTEPLNKESMDEIVRLLLSSDEARGKMATLQDYDGSYDIVGLARFRLNIYRQKGSFAVVMRIIKNTVPPLEKLGLPASVQRITELERGLVLVTGATGSGKTTTLAALINHINQTRRVHILTLEDPIEIIYPKGMSNVSQREIGVDSSSFASALKSALRQDPDVILIGEMRDQETIDSALKASETGHLVFATVHTTDAMRTIGRLLSVFPSEAQPMIRQRLADTLQATVSQRLLTSVDKKERVLAAEIMFCTAIIQDCIRAPEKTGQIKNFIEEAYTNGGMQTFDQHLAKLLATNKITRESALDAATSRSDFLRNLNAESGESNAGIEIDRGD